MHTQTTNNTGVFLPLGIYPYERGRRPSRIAGRDAGKGPPPTISCATIARAEVVARRRDPTDPAPGSAE